MRELAAYDTFERLANRPALELADRVVGARRRSPTPRCSSLSGGSEAVDTAAKLARRYWHALGQPDKQVIVHREHSYHGMNAYGTSLAGIPTNREGFGSADPRRRDRAARRPRRARAAARASAQSEIAAFIGEPVIGAGGIIHPAPGYWQRVQEICRATTCC